MEIPLPPHVVKKKLTVNENGNATGYMIFSSPRKLFRTPVEYVKNTKEWILRAVPFFQEGHVYLYSFRISDFNKKRYIVFYPKYGDFVDEAGKFIKEFYVGVNEADKVVSYYGTDRVEAGIIYNGYLIMAAGCKVKVYGKRRRLLGEFLATNVNDVITSSTLHIASQFIAHIATYKR